MLGTEWIFFLIKMAHPLSQLIMFIRTIILQPGKEAARFGSLRKIMITQDNLQYCKELMAGVVDELRHLEGLIGGIAVNDSEYIDTGYL